MSAAAWVPMMAAMMLPGAGPRVLGQVRAGRPGRAVGFAVAYLAVWALVGVLVYALYRPHGAAVAGAVVIAAGGYELSSLKRRFRSRCHQDQGSGFRYGLCCAGSGIGLMLVLLAVGIMSMPWMAVTAALSFAQKLLPVRAVVDVPVAMAIAALGVWIILAPASVSGLATSM